MDGRVEESVLWWYDNVKIDEVRVWQSEQLGDWVGDRGLNEWIV